MKEELCKTRQFRQIAGRYATGGLLTAFLLLLATAGGGVASEHSKHTGTKLEGFTTAVQPDSITIIDNKGKEIRILTEKDYTSWVGTGSQVTVWYTKQGDEYRLEDIALSNETLLLPADQIRANIKRLIIVPKPGDVENTQGLYAAIATYLQDNIHWFVAPAELGEEMARQVKAPSSPLDAIDLQSGQVDMQHYLDAQSPVVMKIAAEARVDAVLEINVSKVKAPVHNGKASWDDMTEAVASTKTRTFSQLSGLGGKGWVYAATVDMMLWGRSGKLLWKKRRGFAALGYETGTGVKYRARPLTEVYQDAGAMENWLAATLGGLVPPVNVRAPREMPPELKQQLEKAKQAGEAK